MRFFVYFIVAFSPLPFASARPVWQWFWVVFVALFGLYSFLKLRKTSYSESNMLTEMPLWSIVTCLLFVGLGYFQATLVPPQLALEAMIENSGMLSIFTLNPGNSLSVVTFFASHLILFLAVFANGGNKKLSTHILAFIGHLATVYAAYGIIAHYSEIKSVLWFDKWSSGDSLTSTFVNRNNFATYCGIGLCVVLGRFLVLLKSAEAADDSKTRIIFEAQSFFGNHGWWLILELLVLATALLLTASRAGIVASIIGVIFMVLLFVFENKRSRENRVYFLGVFIALGIVLIAYTGDFFLQRVNIGLSDAENRLDAYAIILNIIGEYPIFGLGIGNFEELFRYYRPSSFLGYFDRAHNDYLELIVTAGLLATTLLILCFLICFMHIRKGFLGHDSCYQKALTGLGVSLVMITHALVDFPFQIPALSYMYVIILATSIPTSSWRSAIS